MRTYRLHGAHNDFRGKLSSYQLQSTLRGSLDVADTFE